MSKLSKSPNIINNNISSIQIIKEYKNKYKKNKKIPKNKPKSKILFDNINYINNSRTKIDKLITKVSNQITKSKTLTNFNKPKNKFLIKTKKNSINASLNKNQNKNKIYILNSTKRNNILLETEKEAIYNPEPEPIPFKINKNNNINYNSIMENIFSNKIWKQNNNEILNKNKTQKNFYKNGIINISENVESFNRSINGNNFDKEIKKNKDIKLNFVLKNLDLENLIDCFNYHCIKYNDLFCLNKEDFLEMNIPIGPRNRLINFINEYIKYAKNFDLNELKKFFKNKIKNGIIINDNDNISYTIDNIDNNILKKNNKYNSYRNISNISIFNNYYGNKITNEKYKNKTKIKNNNFYMNKDKEKNKNIIDDNNSYLFHKYNSMSNLLNNNFFYRNEKNEIKVKSFGSFLTFNNDKKIEKNDSYNSPIFNKEKNRNTKKFLYKCNSMKNKHFHKKNKIKEKRKKFVDNFSNINDEVKIFENHLKEIRKKSIETNSKVENLLSKRKNSAYFVNVKNNPLKKENYNSHINSYKQKNILTFNFIHKN